MSQASQPETIQEALMSVEARQFWERVYIAALTHPPHISGSESLSVSPAQVADLAVKDWRKRFEPKVGE